MDKKFFVSLAVLAVFLTFSLIAFSAEEASPAAKNTAVKKLGNDPMIAAANAKFDMISGTVTAINTADPANVTIDVKKDSDGTVHTIQVSPWTNITKITDVTELKAGETVKVMSRKIDEKDTAMGIIFGKIKKTPPVTAAPKAAAPPVAKK